MSDWKFGSDWMAKMGNIGEKTLGPVTIYGGMVMEQCEKNRKKFKAEKLFPDISQAHASAISALVNFLSALLVSPSLRTG